MDLFWTIPYLVAGVIGVTWKPHQGDELVPEEPTSFRYLLLENLLFGVLILAVAALSDSLEGPWHKWGNLAIAVSLAAYALRLTISQNAQQREVHDRQRAEEALRLAHSQLEGLLAEAQCREAELQHLGELVRLVQSCLSQEEACRIIAEAVERLLPNSAGTMYTVATPASARAVAAWGTAPPARSAFSFDRCWAARGAHIHANTRMSSALRCPHLEAESDRSSICVPLMAQQEIVGIIVLLFDQAPVTDNDPTPAGLRAPRSRSRPSPAT
jgi:hypothetical protein